MQSIKLLAGLALSCVIGHAAIALVPGTKNSLGNSSTSIVVAFSGACTAGNLLVVGVINDGSNVTATMAVVGSVNGAYTKAFALFDSVDTTSTYAVWYFPNCASGTDSITVSGVSAPKVFLSEWSGAATVSPLDKTTTTLGAGFGGSPITAAIGATASASLLYGLVNLTNASYGIGSGFTAVNTNISSVFADEYQIGSGLSSIAFTNASPGGGAWGVGGASFKAAGGGGAAAVKHHKGLIQ